MINFDSTWINHDCDFLRWKKYKLRFTKKTLKNESYHSKFFSCDVLLRSCFNASLYFYIVAWLIKLLFCCYLLTWCDENNVSSSYYCSEGNVKASFIELRSCDVQSQAVLSECQTTLICSSAYLIIARGNFSNDKITRCNTDGACEGKRDKQIKIFHITFASRWRENFSNFIFM